MSAVTKFANLRSSMTKNPKIELYLRTCRSLIDLRWNSRITSDEYYDFCRALDHATWHVGTIEAIQSVRDEIAGRVK